MGVGATPLVQPAAGTPLLSLQGVSVDYLGGSGPVRAVNAADLTIDRGEVVGLAGESGSGKSTLALAITRLFQPGSARLSGRILFEGQDLLTMEPEPFRRLRWSKIAIVFQGAMNSLNPVTTIERQIIDALMAHGVRDRSEMRQRARELMDLVQIDSAMLHRYPHELSGGMRQRAVIAIAMAFRPDLLIMDEPTTALDVVVQRQILTHLLELQARFGFAVLFITHDLSVLMEICDRIAVMYAARLVEVGRVEELLDRPRHPYTAGLLKSFPTLTEAAERLQGIPGSPPSLGSLPAGCPFHPRCQWAEERCRTEVPVLRETAAGQWVACHRAGEVNLNA
jgi:peptide/nickel transport system ATP-binding protein